MKARLEADRNVLTNAGLSLLRRKLREVSALAEHYGFREVALHVGVAELALIDLRSELVPYRGDLIAEIERPAPEIPDA